MYSSQYGSYDSTTMASASLYSEQRQQQPAELYNYATTSALSTSQIQQSTVQSTPNFDSAYNYKKSYDTTNTLSAYYDLAVKSQLWNYSLPTWPQNPTETTKQQQQIPTESQSNLNLTPTISSSNSLTYPWTLSSAWDWMSLVPSISPSISPLLNVDSEVTPVHSDISQGSNSYDFSSTASVASSQQTTSTSRQSTPDILTTPDLLTLPVSTLPYTSALQSAAIELNNKSTKIKPRYLRCKCPNCSVPGGNTTIGSNGYPEHICHFSQCKKTFTNISILKAHLRSNHDVDPYVCKICGKKFTRKDGLGRHMKIHNGDKQYECPNCGDKFMRKDHLTQHVYKIHEKPKKKKGGKKNVVVEE